MDQLIPSGSRGRALMLLSGIVFGILLLLGMTYLGFEIQGGVRAYVTGESLWSSGRQQAVMALERYARTGREADWADYREAIRRPLAARRARLELEKSDPDLEAVRGAFRLMGLPQASMDPMIHLYRRLGETSFLDAPTRLWATGDSLLRRLDRQALELRHLVRGGRPGSPAVEASLSRVMETSLQLAQLGDRFNDRLAGVGRRIRHWLRWILGGAALLVVAVAGVGTWAFVLHSERRERDYRDLVAAAPVPMAVRRGDVIQFANDAFGRLLGVDDAETLVGRSTLEYVPEEEQDQVVRRIRGTQEGERAETTRRRWIRTDGSERLTRITGIPVEYRGRSSAFVIAQDVTEELRARRRLRQSEKKYRSLFEASQDAIYLTRADGTIEEMNPAGRDLLGYTQEEFRNMNAREIYRDPSERERFRRAIAGEGSVESFEVDLVTKAGEVRHCELAASTRIDESGEIIGYQGIIRDVTERKRFEERLEWQAMHDPLTDLANRTLLWDRLEQAVARSARGQETIAVVFMDLDRFKAVNDCLGHAAGDQLLVETARRIRGCLRRTDTAARVAGDEFILLLEELDDRRDADRVVERLRMVLQRPFEVEGESIRIDVSLGVAVTDVEPDAGGSSREVAERLIRQADTAMYEAKDRPGTQHRTYSPEMESEETVRVQRENALRRAIEEEQFVLHYQPIVDLQTGRIEAVEPLVRWRRPDGTLLDPATFLPLAEETGLIVPLGDWILERACQQLRGWSTTLDRGERLELHPNLSATQFEEPGLLDRLEGILGRSQLDPDRLNVEVTEHTVMQAPERTERLHELGTRICVDDFGTGYSSLSYVKRLAVDALKIDTSFVHGIGESSEDEAIIETILTLGRALDLEVVAEGVENEGQREWLTERGCDRAQGWLFSRALPPERCGELPGWPRGESRKGA